MLKGNLLKVIGETAQGSNLTRIEKFEVFCRVCDNMLAEGASVRYSMSAGPTCSEGLCNCVSCRETSPLQPVGEVVHNCFPDPSHAL